MKLLISRDTSDVSSRFLIYNSSGNLLFTVGGKHTAAGERIKAFDQCGKCVFKITSTPEIGSITGYNVVTPDTVFAVTVKVLCGDVKLKIHGLKLFIRGCLLSRQFEITDVSAQTLATHQPEAGKLDRYTLDISDDTNFTAILAIAICADLLSFSDSAATCRA